MKWLQQGQSHDARGRLSYQVTYRTAAMLSQIFLVGDEQWHSHMVHAAQSAIDVKSVHFAQKGSLSRRNRMEVLLNRLSGITHASK